MRAERWHGTLGGYTNHRCRCQPCRDANTEWQRGARLRRAANIPPGIHGKASTYENYMCRCRPCTDAHAAAWRTYRRRSA